MFGKCYKNELCFDSDTIASNKLKTLCLTNMQKKCVDKFYGILKHIKESCDICKQKYKHNKKYGTYQIIKEVNLFDKVDRDIIYDCPELNTKLNQLKEISLKELFLHEIKEKLFKYELLK
jgi:hypothetical protein